TALTARPSSGELRLYLGRPQRLVVPVLQRHRHDLRGAVDGDMAEELQVVIGADLRRILGRRLLEHDLRAERIVEVVRSESSGVDRRRYEFPERLEVLELGLVRIVAMRRGVVYVGGQPHGVAYARVLDEGEDVGDLELPPARRSVALRHRLDAPFAIAIIDH